MNITIVGGGFGGVKAALELAKNKSAHVTLISNSQNFQYYPALYSTATGHSGKESWVPLSQIFRNCPNITLVYDEILTINPEKKQLKGKTSTYSYHILILALGSVTTYFGIEGLDTYSFGIKSEYEIRKLQQHLRDDMSDGREDETRYVIIGGGPTGVELAGALGEYIRSLRKHYKIAKKRLNITVVEASSRILPRGSVSISRRAKKRLESLGVRVETNKRVEKETADSLIINGKPLKTQTVIWTSGVANAPFFKNNAKYFTLNERGKVVVDAFMRARPSVYVIGDSAATPYSGMAQTALHDAQFVARHIRGDTMTPYKAVVPASVVPIGENWATFEWKNIKFAGWLGNIMREWADVIGYHDILPIGWAIDTWHAGKKRQLFLPKILRKK